MKLSVHSNHLRARMKSSEGAKSQFLGRSFSTTRQFSVNEDEASSFSSASNTISKSGKKSRHSCHPLQKKPLQKAVRLNKLINHWKMVLKKPASNIKCQSKICEFAEVDLQKQCSETQAFFKKVYYEDYYKGAVTRKI